MIPLCGLFMYGCSSYSPDKSIDAQAQQIHLSRPAPVASNNIQTISLQEKILRKKSYAVASFSENTLYDLLAAELGSLRDNRSFSQEKYSTQARLTRDPGVVERAAKMAAHYNNSVLSLEMTKLWLEVEPSRIKAFSMYAISLLRSGFVDEAIPHIALTLKHGDTAPLIELFTSYSNAETDQLLSYYKTIEAQNPDNFFLRMVNASLLHDKGLIEESLEITNQLLKSIGKDHVLFDSVFELEILNLFRQGKENEANLLLGQSSMNEERKRRLNIKSAKGSLEKNLQTGHQKLKILLEQYPNDEEIIYLLAFASKALSRDVAAVKLFERIIQTNANNWRSQRAHFELGELHRAQGNNIKSIFHLQRYLENTNTGHVKGQGNFYRVASASSLLMESMTSKEEVAKLRSIFRGLRTKVALLSRMMFVMEGQILIEQLLLNDGYNLLSEAIFKHPGDTGFLYVRSVISGLLGDYSRSEDDLRALLIINPDHPIALNALGYSMTIHSDRYDEARALILKSLRLAPEAAETLDSLGWVYFQQGNHTEAIKYLTQALSYLSKPEPEIYSHLGEVLWVIGEKNKAKSVWEQILRQDPSNIIINKTLKRLEVE